MKYTFIKENRALFSIARMCKVLRASRSGFYGWLSRRSQPSARAVRQKAIDEVVRRAFEERRGRSGAPRITFDLRDSGCHADRKTVAASMRRQGLRAKAARKFKATTCSRHTLPVAPNLLNQDFHAADPNSKWVGDITYLWSDEGWSYLAVVIDLYSRKVVGWSLASRMTADLVCEALEMAQWRRGRPRKVIVHSDRGSQYCSNQYQALLQRHEHRCSMSAKGNCYDNAVAESFFHSLKVEAIHGERFKSREALRQQVFEYIELDYNQQRRHSAVGMISPAAFEARLAA